MTTEYRIETSGEAPAHLSPVDEHLRSILADMEAVVRLSRGEHTSDDLERLEIDANAPDFDPWDACADWLEGYALEISTARWDIQDGLHDDNIARIRLCLGLGGPNVWLDILCNSVSGPERVVLDRYWSGHDAATTEDGEALRVVYSFISTFWAE